jgi:hypothetical protein
MYINPPSGMEAYRLSFDKRSISSSSPLAPSPDGLWREDRGYYRDCYTDTDKGQVAVYIRSLNAKQAQTLEIARQHLKTSFDILKSGGYLEYADRWNKIVRKWRTWAMLRMWRLSRKSWRGIICRYRDDLECECE